MRLLFFILLIANLAVFAWYEWLNPAVGPAASQPLPAAKPLQLLSELSPAARRALAKSASVISVPLAASAAVPAPAAGTRAAAANAPVVCASYGPLPSLAAAQSGADRLHKLGLGVNERLVPGKVRLGYWVYLPPFGTRHEAEAAEKMLKARGVEDLYVVTDEANRNALSLGVFSQRDGALDRRAQIRKLGLHPVFAERFRDAPRYWLDVRGPENALPGADTLADLGEGDTPPTRQSLACETNSVAP